MSIEKFLLTLDENHSPVLENVIFNEKDLYINFDRWKREHGKNILYITGLSGSGKSYLAEQLESNYNAEMFELDGFEGNYDSSKSNFLEKYKKFNPDIPINNRFKGVSNGEKFKYYKKFFEWLVSEMKLNYNKLYIIEGIQIYYIKPTYIKYEPVIIKGSSVLTSIIQRIRRSDRDGIKLKNKDIIKEIFRNRLILPRWLYEDDKILNEMRTEIKMI